MRSHAHKNTIRITAFVLAIFIVLGMLPIAGLVANAAEDGWTENIELTGEYTGTFTFSTNTGQLFNVENAAPGDSWSGSINIINKSPGPMEVSLLSIVSDLEDTDLYKALTLDILVGQNVVYSGSYGDTVEPISPYYVIGSGQKMVMNVTVGMPKELGNEMMGEEMESTWTFDARYLGDGPGPSLYPYTVSYVDEWGEDLAPPKRGYAEYDAIVTERAIYIEGYTPDKAVKSITIRSTNNEIIFVYSKDDAGGTDPNEPTLPPNPTDPKDPTDHGKPGGKDDGKKPENVQTGVELDEGVSSGTVYGCVGILCAVAILVIYLRIRAIKRDDENKK